MVYISNCKKFHQHFSKRVKGSPKPNTNSLDKHYHKKLVELLYLFVRNLDHALFEGLDGTGIIFTIYQYCKLRPVCIAEGLRAMARSIPRALQGEVQGEALAFIARFVNTGASPLSSPTHHQIVIKSSLRFYCQDKSNGNLFSPTTL